MYTIRVTKQNMGKSGNGHAGGDPGILRPRCRVVSREIAETNGETCCDNAMIIGMFEGFIGFHWYVDSWLQVFRLKILHV